MGFLAIFLFLEIVPLYFVLSLSASVDGVLFLLLSRVESEGTLWPLTLSHSDHDRLVLPIAIAVTQSIHIQPKSFKFPLSSSFSFSQR